MDSKLTLLFEAVPNIDFTSGHLAEVSVPLQFIKVDDLLSARSAYCELVARYELGGGNITSRCGRVCSQDGQRMARISYNGRVWDNDGNEIII